MSRQKKVLYQRKKSEFSASDFFLIYFAKNKFTIPITTVAAPNTAKMPLTPIDNCKNIDNR